MRKKCHYLHTDGARRCTFLCSVFLLLLLERIFVKMPKRKLEVVAESPGDVSESGGDSAKGKIDNRSRHCPYLDTINRVVLDFDFEKLCSISLSKINVYACLVCGKYFQGKNQLYCLRF